MKARYDLARKIASFDFFNWMLHVKALGATEVVFGIDGVKTDKWDAAQVRRRYESILLPGVPLAGLKSSVGEGGKDLAHTDIANLVKFVREGGRIGKLKSVLPAASERYTVTLRKTQRAPGRDSNDSAWRQFAREINARVIEDYDVEPIGLHERLALYAGAEMNFFVSSGPAMLCGLAGLPAMVFSCQVCTNVFLRCGLDPGTRWPWMGERQYMIWEPDDLPVLRRHLDYWKEKA